MQHGSSATGSTEITEAVSSPGLHSPEDTRSIFSGPSTTTATTPGTSTTYATDSLCPREMVLWMLDDFLTSLYPLIPVIHRPSFRRSIAMNQDKEDSDLRGLIYGLCAAVVGTMPSKYLAYRNHTTPLQFESRQKFIDHAYTVLLQLRGPDLSLIHI